MKLFAIIFLSVLIISSCETKAPTSAQAIIDSAIEKSCSGNCENAQIEFDFRKRKYKSIRNGSTYQLERTFQDSTGNYRDILSNDGFKRYRNDTLKSLSDSLSVVYGNSVNSVHYFAQLPYGLNAPAVQKELLKDIKINGEPYYVIGVTFTEENGGTDHDDEFVYWIHKFNKTVDYLAYSYTVNGGGIRFREAYNPRVIEGIRFVDYNNYKPKKEDVDLQFLPALLKAGELTLLSKIETENIKVSLTSQ